MTDLTFSRSGELDVTQIEGNTDAGIEFVDAVTVFDLVVVDAGRIIVPSDNAVALQELATLDGLTVEDEVVR